VRRAPLALTTLLAALAGCGGEDEPGSRGSVTAASGQPVPVKGYEYGFDPGTITIRGARSEAQVRFELKNDGTLPHDLHVREGDEELGGTDAIGGGESAGATVRLARGEYEVYCSIGDHAELGMTGTLRVE
jgi:plastocyanin